MNSPATRDIVVIGGSAGSGAVLKTLMQRLPADLPASLFVTTHIPAHSPGFLAEILSSRSALPVMQAVDGQPVERGHVYLAAPDRHLLLIDGIIRLGFGPRENMVRPAIDPLFRSAALSLRSARHRRDPDRHAERRRGRAACGKGVRRAGRRPEPRRCPCRSDAAGGPADDRGGSCRGRGRARRPARRTGERRGGPAGAAGRESAAGGRHRRGIAAGQHQAAGHRQSQRPVLPRLPRSAVGGPRGRAPALPLPDRAWLYRGNAGGARRRGG